MIRRFWASIQAGSVQAKYREIAWIDREMNREHEYMEQLAARRDILIVELRDLQLPRCVVTQ